MNNTISPRDAGWREELRKSVPAKERTSIPRCTMPQLAPDYRVTNNEEVNLGLSQEQAVLELPLKQRLVFNLRYYDGMSYGQIARVLGQREQTLKVNYHYAVQKLKEKLTQEI